METSLKHILKEEFTVCYVDDKDTRRYITTIYSNSISTDANIDNAFKVKTEEEAQAVVLLAKSVSNACKSYPVKIVHVATIVEDIDDNSLTEEKGE